MTFSLYVRACNKCGQEYAYQRNTSKFCCAICRVTANRVEHKNNNKELPRELLDTQGP